MTARGFDAIAGQDTAVNTLRRAVRDDRLAQSYLFEGPGGVGKELAAIALARAVLCDQARVGACDCSTCRRIESGQHPDVRIYRPRDQGDRNIKVEFVREEILRFTQFAPFEARAAFVIFPEADVSFPVNHAEAANALLKTLEEPRPHVHFILLAERPDRLLPTIRSRCQRLRFHALTPEVLDQILVAHAIPDAARGPAISLAEGRADRALSLCGEGRAEGLLELVLQIDDALQTAVPAVLLDVSHDLAARDDLPLVLSALGIYYRDLSALNLGIEAAKLAFGHARSELEARAHRVTPAVAATRVQRVQQTLEQLQRNANTELSINALLFALA